MCACRLNFMWLIFGSAPFTQKYSSFGQFRYRIFFLISTSFYGKYPAKRYCSLTLCLNLVDHYWKEKYFTLFFIKKSPANPGCHVQDWLWAKPRLKTKLARGRYIGRRKDIV